MRGFNRPPSLRNFTGSPSSGAMLRAPLHWLEQAPSCCLCFFQVCQLFAGVFAACAVGFKHAPNFIAHLPEDFQDFFFAAQRVGGVNEPPVIAVHLSREDWTG